MGSGVLTHSERRTHRHPSRRRQAVWPNFWRRRSGLEPSSRPRSSRSIAPRAPARAPRRIRPVRKHLERKRRGERGAVLVEAALVLPIVLTLLLGLVEFGFIWKDELTISNATRSAVRVGSADGKNAASDYDMLQQIKSSVGALPGGTATIQRVIVWKATTSSSVPTECLNATWPVGVSGTNGVYCNIYVPSDFNRPVTDFTCASSATSPDKY